MRTGAIVMNCKQVQRQLVSYINGELEEKEEEEEVRLQHHDLIDSFIKNEEQRTPGSGLNLDMETTGAPVPGNLAELEENQHKPLDDS